MWLMHLAFLISKIILHKWLVHVASETMRLGRHLSAVVPLHRCVCLSLCLLACLDPCDCDFEELQQCV